jgi:hypothetical protein
VAECSSEEETAAKRSRSRKKSKPRSGRKGKGQKGLARVRTEAKEFKSARNNLLNDKCDSEASQKLAATNVKEPHNEDLDEKENLMFAASHAMNYDESEAPTEVFTEKPQTVMISEESSRKA